MVEVTKHTPGTFCWVDLTTTDAAASKRFYGELMGWSAHDEPIPGGGAYTMLSKGDKAVGGLFEMDSGMREQGIPPHWNSYVAVESADASTSKIKASGGNVMMEPFDVMDVGRMAVVQDPTGAVFSLWEPKKHIGAEVIYEPSALGWNELNTRDVDAATKFYGDVFGWGANSNPIPMGGVYTEFKLGDQSVGGMMAIREEWGEVPPNWAVYFAVADCDASLKKAEDLGATAVVPVTDVESVRFAFVRDPQGVYFGIVQMK